MGSKEDRAQNCEPKTLSLVSAVSMARRERESQYGYTYSVLSLMTTIEGTT